MDYTQEQLDKMVADGIAEATTGLFTKDDLQKEVTREADRRVESGIEKGLATQKAKWEAELAEKAKLTAEELASKEFSDRIKDLEARENTLTRGSNLLNAKSKLVGADIPSSYYESMIESLVINDAIITEANIDNLIKVYTTTKSEIEAKVKAEFSNVTPPKKDEVGDTTKDKFSKMGYGEKLKLKETNPELYKSFMS